MVIFCHSTGQVFITKTIKALIKIQKIGALGLLFFDVEREISYLSTPEKVTALFHFYMLSINLDKKKQQQQQQQQKLKNH